MEASKTKQYCFFYLQMVLEFECLSTITALEPPQDRRLVMGDHVALQPVHIGKLFLANLAHLKKVKVYLKNRWPASRM